MHDRSIGRSRIRAPATRRANATFVAFAVACGLLGVSCGPALLSLSGTDDDAREGAGDVQVRSDVAPDVGRTEPSVVQAALDAWVCPDDGRWNERPTLFVAPEGSDSAGGRTIEQPLRTLQAAIDRAEPGDVVWLRSGVYREPVVIERSGTDSAPIVIASAPGECAILAGPGSDPDSGERRAQLTLRGVEHVGVRHLVVRDASAEGVLIEDSRHVVLDGLHLYGNHFSGLTNVRGADNRFVRIVAHDNVDGSFGGDSDGISVSSGRGHRVERCIVFANSDDGVDTWTSIATVVERCLAFGNGQLAGDGVGVKAGGNGADVGTLVRWSVSFGNRAHGFDDNTGGSVRFERNTAFGNARIGFAVGDATLSDNLALWNEGGDHVAYGNGGDDGSNSWSLGVSAGALASVDPSATDFLSPLPGSAADGLGALAAGETLASWLGVGPAP